jgi:hypothetical protein
MSNARDGLVPGGFSSSGPGLPRDQSVEPEREVQLEQVETDPAIWPEPRCWTGQMIDEGRDVPGSVEHKPTKIRPYATLTPDWVVRAREIIASAGGRFDGQPTDANARRVAR